MNNRKAFEKWLFSLPADLDASRFPEEHKRWPMPYRDYPVQLTAKAWQAYYKHYEVVMRRAAVFAWLASNGRRGAQAEDVDAIIAQAKAAGR